MKLHNLLEYDKPKHDLEIDHTDESAGSLEDYIKQYGGKELGRGFFGIVYDKPGAVHTVIKRGRVRVDGYQRFKDGYLNFVLNLMNDRRARYNPFLPQIFSVKIKYDNNQNYTYIIELEKLEEFADNSKMFTRDEALKQLSIDPHSHYSQMVNMLSKLVNVTDEQLVNLTYNHYGENSYSLTLKHIWNVIRDVISGKMSKVRESNIKITNKKFLEAVLLMKRYQNDDGFDLHSQNVMIRRTPYGPQLVITDPYS